MVEVDYNNTKPINSHRMEMDEDRKSYFCLDCGLNIFRAMKERCTNQTEPNKETT